MAGLALLAESALVHVLVRMAFDALERRTREAQARVALRAAIEAVQTEQREFGQIVIENDLGAPAALAVAGVAAAFELAAVRVLAAMAAEAVLGELLFRDDARVAGIAIGLGVCAHQRKFGLNRMIIRRRMPFLAVMAGLAFGAEARRMRVVRRVAAVAVLGNLFLVISAAMARETVDVRMHAEQRVMRFLEVIEFRCLPFLDRVAFAAVRTARAAVLIVGRMTSDARFRRLLVVAFDVAGIAGDRLMRARELEIRLVVLELAARPSLRAVALAAGFRQLAAVNVIGLVAADAGRRRLAPGLARLVAGVAGERKMRAFEFEIGQAMIELCAVELHDIRIAALVFRVAGAAFADARVRHAAVIALVFVDVGRGLFVAIEAERSLRARVRAVVTIAATLFLFDMGARDLARHQQGLD